jgi:hypothetical protein
MTATTVHVISGAVTLDAVAYVVLAFRTAYAIFVTLISRR